MDPESNMVSTLVTDGLPPKTPLTSLEMFGVHLKNRRNQLNIVQNMNIPDWHKEWLRLKGSGTAPQSQPVPSPSAKGKKAKKQ